MLEIRLKIVLTSLLAIGVAFVSVPRCDSLEDLLVMVSELAGLEDAESFKCHVNDLLNTLPSSSDRFSISGCQCQLYLLALALPAPIIESDSYLFIKSIAMLDSHGPLISDYSTEIVQSLRPPIAG